ncbi:MAG TPA: hypothetical protein P5120_04165 [Spirochaetota bacterium]|nr:hypothetical protein [Spirochaetota bacterium]HPF06162.1 hypothetical protein [Spirochaetota bacterium]HPJ41300.1 hypothetical protein [Spirochaetota bacterium]HPR37034.1 hypothetical protein [Spirochaetota bacterium]HRX46691.1 hypothetical protein [Spirochaetota bacterium]
MIRSIVRIISLLIFCALIFSCGADTKEMLKNQMLDTAINTAKDSATDSSSKSSNKGGFFGRGSGDAHFFEDDYILIATEAYKRGWIKVRVAKVVTPASKATKNEGKFMYVSDGEEAWTKYFYSTRIATSADLKIGKIIFACEAHSNDSGVYLGPEEKSETYDSWFMSKITDMSDRHKGYVTVAGNYKVSVDALRVSVK